MPRPARRPVPRPDTHESTRPLAKASGGGIPTPEEMAKATVAKITSSVGAPDKAELVVRPMRP